MRPRPEVISALRKFGLRLGTAYQIYDDVLDLAGEETKAGKTLGSDLRKGKLTLPILHLLQNSSSEERDRYFETILSGDEAEVRHLVSRALETGAVGLAVAAGRRMLREAGEQLALLPASRYRESLGGLCETLDGLISRFQR